MLPDPSLIREEFSKILHISFSALMTFLTCPRRYRYHYVEGQPWETSPSALAFGRAIHQAVASLHSWTKEKGSKPPLSELNLRFEGFWKKECSGEVITYKEGESEELLREKGKDLLAVYWREHESRNIEAVEYPFAVELIDPFKGQESGYRLVGVFDLIESDEQGNLIISELKTAARRQDENTVRNNMQASVYGYAMKKLGFTTSQRLTLIRLEILVKTKEPTLQLIFLTKDDDDYRKILSLAHQVLRAIELRVFYPNYGWWCSECPFKKRCAKDLI